jgi:hypothetical protein
VLWWYKTFEIRSSELSSQWDLPRRTGIAKLNSNWRVHSAIASLVSEILGEGSDNLRLIWCREIVIRSSLSQWACFSSHSLFPPIATCSSLPVESYPSPKSLALLHSQISNDLLYYTYISMQESLLSFTRKTRRSRELLYIVPACWERVILAGLVLILTFISPIVYIDFNPETY